MRLTRTLSYDVLGAMALILATNASPQDATSAHAQSAKAGQPAIAPPGVVSGEPEGVTVVPPPPAGFDPTTASAEENARYAIPPAPDARVSPEGHAAWAAAVTAKARRESPVLTKTKITNGPMRIGSRGGLRYPPTPSRALPPIGAVLRRSISPIRMTQRLSRCTSSRPRRIKRSAPATEAGTIPRSGPASMATVRMMFCRAASKRTPIAMEGQHPRFIRRGSNGIQTAKLESARRRSRQAIFYLSKSGTSVRRRVTFTSMIIRRT